MSRVIQIWGMAAGLFSNALFCLWLSTASLVVWVDFGASPAEQLASIPAEPVTVAPAPTDAIKHH